MVIRLGVDMGASTVKLALPGKPIRLAVTGSNSRALLEVRPKLLQRAILTGDVVYALPGWDEGFLSTLEREGNTALRAFADGHGRYRYAKTVELGKRANAVLAMAPRYENSWFRLCSFLYYC